MPPYNYSSPPALGSDSIRLLRLMPSEDEAATIKCQLCNYPLRRSTQKTHLYEALSYVWGSSVKDYSISIDGYDLAVTANLHNALSRLRDHYFERIIWADSICINQENDREKESQIQLMAMIYAQANRVIVYLGEAADDSDQALEDIRVAAEDDQANLSIDEKRQEAIFKLLERPWFRRIWVLQEAAVARRILIKCGSMEINGYPFCIGINKLVHTYNPLGHLQSLIGPVTHLIRGATFRPKYATVPSGLLSLGELLDMYHTHEATMHHDKVYALLGMASDNTNEAGLSPNYSVAWNTLWQRLIQFILPKNTFFETWTEKEIVVVKSKGRVLGHVASVAADSTGYGRQHIEVVLDDFSEHAQWILQASAKPIQRGDIICLLQEASKPVILRPFKDYFAIIMIAVKIHPEIKYNQLQGYLANKKVSSRNFLLVWNWEKPAENVRDGKEHDASLVKINTLLPDYLKTNTDEVTRSYDVALALGDSKQFKKAEERLQKAKVDCEKMFKKEDLPTLACTESLALTYKNEGYFKYAIGLLWKIMRKRKQLQGSSHENTLNSMANLVSSYIDHEIDDDNIWKESFPDRIRKNSQLLEEDIIKIGKSRSVKQLIDILSDLERDKIPVTTNMLEEAAKNGMLEIMEMLLNYGGARVSVTEEVVKTAAEKHDGMNMITPFFKIRDSEVKVTEEVLKRAAGNEYKGKEILSLLFDRFTHEIKITEEVLKVAARNEYYGKEILSLLFDRCTNEVKITEEVLKVAARNIYKGKGIISLLFDRCKHEVEITEELLKVAARNIYDGKEILSLLFDRFIYKVKITEEVLKVAAGNEYKGKEILSVLFDRCIHEVKITEEVLKVAARNEYNGTEILSLIFDRYTHEVKITEEVLKEAASNVVGGYEILRVIHGTSGISVTLGMIEAAATSGNEKILELFDKWGALHSNKDQWFKIASLYNAAIAGDAAKIRQLLMDGTPPDKQNIHGVTPLWNALLSGNLEVVEVLLATGAVNVNAQDRARQTPLFRAAARGYSRVVRILLDHCADPNYEDMNGDSPISMARKRGHEDVVAMLTEHQSKRQKSEGKKNEQELSQVGEEI